MSLMSDENPDNARSPHSWLRKSSVLSRFSFFSFWICRTIAGSIVPERVPIGRPSRGVYPIEVSRALPPTDAVMEDPLPR